MSSDMQPVAVDAMRGTDQMSSAVVGSRGGHEYCWPLENTQYVDPADHECPRAARQVRVRSAAGTVVVENRGMQCSRISRGWDASEHSSLWQLERLSSLPTFYRSKRAHHDRAAERLRTWSRA